MVFYQVANGMHVLAPTFFLDTLAWTLFSTLGFFTGIGEGARVAVLGHGDGEEGGLGGDDQVAAGPHPVVALELNGERVGRLPRRPNLKRQPAVEGRRRDEGHVYDYSIWE